MNPQAVTQVAEIRVCAGSGCVANGSLEAAAHFDAAIEAAGAGERVRVVRTGCHGLCAQGPVVVIAPDGTFYPGVDAAAADRIVAALLAGEGAVRDLLYREDADTVIERHDDIEFNARQQRIVRNYYENRDQIMMQSLGELVTELYLAETYLARNPSVPPLTREEFYLDSLRRRYRQPNRCC